MVLVEEHAPITRAPDVGVGGMVTSALVGVGSSLENDANITSAWTVSVAVQVTVVVRNTVVLVRVVWVDGENSMV